MHARNSVWIGLITLTAMMLAPPAPARAADAPERGYVAIMVDGFGPRGYPQGFPRFSYESRPAELNEVTIRPLDAYGALAYLRTRSDVLPDRIALQGWSNGGSAALSTMS